MNMLIFDRLIADEYQQSDCSYSLDDVLNVFHTFFSSYRQTFGQDHPFLKREQIRRIIEKMPYISDVGYPDVIIDLEPGNYPVMIEAYFNTQFAPGCNYRINHFFNGDIRAIKYYETCY